jgi:hypothetical protein
MHREHATFTLWIWILCNVTRKQINYVARGQQIVLEPGELVFGRNRLAAEMGLTSQMIRTCLKNLKNWKNLTIRSTNRFSILKVTNWELYQETETQINQQINQELTSIQPATNQLPNHKTRSKEVKNVKNKESGGNGIPDWIPKDLWADFKEFRIRIKAPLTDRAVKNIISELEKFKSEGQDPLAVINQSITRGWRGVFAIVDKTKSVHPTQHQEKNSLNDQLRKAQEREKYLKGEL